jgi:DNA modification methylase
VSFKIIPGDCLEVLKTLPAESVHTCVTSPPYWGLRDYGVEGQIGLEATPELFVSKMVEVFREVKRVLRDDGTLWLNLGDSYAGPNNGYSGDDRPSNKNGGSLSAKNGGQVGCGQVRRMGDGLKPKDLCGIPWLVAFALRADGWYLRQEIIWNKPNPMPESVTDRCTKSHESIFLLTKSARYYFDSEAIKEPASTAGQPIKMADGWDTGEGGHGTIHRNGREKGEQRGDVQASTRNKRSVWTVATAPFSGAHFATFPPKLIEPCILAGTSQEGACKSCGAPRERVVERTGYPDPENNADDQGRRKASGEIATDTQRRKELSGAKHAAWKAEHPDVTTGWQPSCTCNAETQPCTVLDPFAGAGTTGLVARRLGRSFIGIELNPEYLNMAENRIVDDSPLFNRLPVEPSSLTLPDALRSQGESK